jgi:alpha/beta superfamily hydrolase
MPRRIESLFLPGLAGKLEALLEEPEDADPVEAAVICHPHPQHGGTMHNKVVYRLARGLRKSGCVVLRFNYRGVNLSEGAYDRGLGETEDARVALRELQSRYPYLPVMAAGFSFGSRIALRLTSQEKIIQRVIPVGFPTTIAEHAFVNAVHVPKFFVQSTHDNFAPRPDFEKFFETVPLPKHVEWIESADHFFKDALDDYETAILRIGLNRG